MTQNEIAQLLPEIFQRTLRQGSPLNVLLEVMETLHAPSEAALASLDGYFDPYRTPDEFVPFLAMWVDLGELIREAPEQFAADDTPPIATGSGRLRELIAAAAFLSKWRGTYRGLQRFLETATGVTGFTIDENVRDLQGQILPYHIKVTAPSAVERFRPMLEHIIAIEKPAYVTYELAFR